MGSTAQGQVCELQLYSGKNSVKYFPFQLGIYFLSISSSENGHHYCMIPDATDRNIL